MPTLIQRIMTPEPGTASPIAGLFLRFRTPATWEPGSEFEGTIGWALYHVLEHEAAHYGQINLLRHQYRSPTAAER